MPDAPTPGSIADTVARLLLWCRRSDHGFIRIVFDDGRARDAVIEQLGEALGPDTPFHQLNLPPAASANILAERLADELTRLGPGVISITGFEVSLPTSGSALEAALRALNSRRENFARPNQHTLWWFPRHVAQAISREHHDLNSWFLKRTELTEIIASPDERAINGRWLEASRLRRAAKFCESESLVRQILAHEEANLGAIHPRVAAALSNLAQLLQATNRLAEAEPLIRRALAIDEAIFGPNHPEVAADLNNLASLLHDANRLAEAEPLHRRALAILESNVGNDHPNVAAAINNLAQLLQDTNRLAEAEPLMRRALAINEASFGPNHPKVAIRLNNLATLLKDTKRLAEAEPLMRRALAIDEASFGPDHPEVAVRLNNLALLLKDTNRLAEAEPLLRRHLEIFVNSARANGHPPRHLKDAINNYGNLLVAMGDTPEQTQAKLDQILGDLRVS